VYRYRYYIADAGDIRTIGIDIGESIFIRYRAAVMRDNSKMSAEVRAPASACYNEVENL